MSQRNARQFITKLRTKLRAFHVHPLTDGRHVQNLYDFLLCVIHPTHGTVCSIYQIYREFQKKERKGFVRVERLSVDVSLKCKLTAKLGTKLCAFRKK